MEWVAFGIALLSLALSIYGIIKPRIQTHYVEGVATPPPFSRKARRPTVRDELAGWRQEQREKYEWESELRQRGLE